MLFLNSLTTKCSVLDYLCIYAFYILFVGFAANNWDKIKNILHSSVP